MPIVETELFPTPGEPGILSPLMNGTAAVGASVRWAHEDHIHPIDTSLSNNPTFTGTATFNGPAVFNGTATFSGIPTAPTAAPGTNNTQIATTAYADSAVGVERTRALAAEALLAPIASPTFTGTVTIPVGASISGYAPLASPTFTGVPLSTTPAANDNTTKIATTAFVLGQVGTANPLVNGTVAVGTSLLYARQDHVHPIDTSRMATAGGQTITGGFNLTPNNLGTAAGTVTPNPLLGNYQYVTNNAAFTLAAPTSDCAMDVLVTNGAAAGAITFSGYTVAAGNTGDPLTTTNTSKFIISIRRINAVATYTIKALQ